MYETSAGGVVLRHIRGAWQVAIIEPNIINADTITRRAKARPEGTVFALPKGGVDEGETPEQSADREVFEETGVRGLLLFRLTTIRYLYQRSWGGREHVSKAVSFYLFLYQSGRLGQIHPEMRDEVRKAFWFPLDKAHRKLTYRGEREVLKMAQKIVREHPERLTPPPPSACGQRSGGAASGGAAAQRLAARRTGRRAQRPPQSRGPAQRRKRRQATRGGQRDGASRRPSARRQRPDSAPPRGPHSEQRGASGPPRGSDGRSQRGQRTRRTESRPAQRPRSGGAAASYHKET